MLIDTHCHLGSRKLHDEAEALIERALEAGVDRIVAIGTNLEDGPRCLALADQFQNVFATVGIHPTAVTEVMDPDWLEKIADWATHPKVVAIGELGLDYYHAPPKSWTEWDYHARQKNFLRSQLDLAVSLGKNVVVHNRNSLADTIAEITAYNGRLRAVFHCYIDSWESAQSLVEADHLISFTGIATFKSAPEVQACATDATVGQFMLETDSPYLAPAPYRGKRCEPAYVRHTAEAIAAYRGETLEALAAHTTQTAERFFHLG